MDAVNDVRGMWEEWKSIPFPAGYGGVEVAGVCVTMLDSNAAGCIHTFILNKGRLDDGRISILSKCRRELEIVIPNLGDEARVYFKNLLMMAERVLQLVGAEPRGAA